jgi:hypothetical protein
MDRYQLLSRVESRLPALENHDWTSGKRDKLICVRMIDKGGTASVFQMYDNKKHIVRCLICFS